MNKPTHDLARGLDSIVEAAESLGIIHEVRDLLEQLNSKRTADELRKGDGLEPDVRYNYADVAHYLGMKRSSVRQLDTERLPRCGGGYVLGIDIMAYRGEVTYEEAQAYKEARRALVLRSINRAA